MFAKYRTVTINFHFDVNGWFVESRQEFQVHMILPGMRKVRLMLDDKEHSHLLNSACI
jgi:hypothetical protein